MLVSDLIDEGSRMFRVHRRDILGDYRFAYIQPCRRAIMIAMRERGASFPQIGRWMQRDHSSVIHAIRNGRLLMEKDRDYAAKVNRLINFGRPNG